MIHTSDHKRIGIEGTLQMMTTITEALTMLNKNLGDMSPACLSR